MSSLNLNPDGFFCCVFYRCVEHLLRNRANASKRDKQGYSPVHYAAARGHKLALEMVRCTIYRTPYSIFTHCFFFSFPPVFLIKLTEFCAASQLVIGPAVIRKCSSFKSSGLTTNFIIVVISI